MWAQVHWTVLLVMVWVGLAGVCAGLASGFCCLLDDAVKLMAKNSSNSASGWADDVRLVAFKINIVKLHCG